MNIYDWMRHITAKTPGVTETFAKDTEELIKYLEGLNAFGAVARANVSEHKHEYQWNAMNIHACRLCGEPNPVQPPLESKWSMGRNRW